MASSRPNPTTDTTTTDTAQTAPRVNDQQQADLNTRAAQVLGLDSVHVETLNARPLTHSDIADLAATKTSTDDIACFVSDEVGFLLPATLHLLGAEDVPGAIENPKGSKGSRLTHIATDEIVGEEIKAAVSVAFGHLRHLRLYTTPEAEESVGLRRGEKSVAASRNMVYLADPDAAPRPVMPVFGSQASLSFIVEGADPTVLATRLHQVLTEEFGESLSALVKVQTRPVENRRVDFFDRDGRAVAIGVLKAETGMVMEKYGQGIESRTHVPVDVMMGR